MTRCEYGIANLHKGAWNSQLPLGQAPLGHSFNRNVIHHPAPLAIAAKRDVSQTACPDDQFRPTGEVHPSDSRGSSHLGTFWGFIYAEKKKTTPP